MTALDTIARHIAQRVRGQAHTIRYVLAALISGGHVLLEDLPGTGKTTLTKALAAAVGARFTRIQFTPDLLPSDILGLSVFDQAEQQFRFHPGPVFTHILLADEINRASPRTQSALLEAMAEQQVTLDGVTRRLDALFFVMATQNPVEFRGTYPLPEAQMDRFAMQLTLGYLDLEQEVALLTASPGPLRPDPCVAVEDILTWREAATRIPVSRELDHYIVTLVRSTRGYPGVKMGASPRASLAIRAAAQGLALIDEAEFVTPEHIQELAVPMIAHRLVLGPDARFAGITAAAIVKELLKATAVPH